MNCSKCNKEIPPLENHGADTDPLCYACANPEVQQSPPIATYKPEDKWRSYASITLSVILIALATMKIMDDIESQKAASMISRSFDGYGQSPDEPIDIRIEIPVLLYLSALLTIGYAIAMIRRKVVLYDEVVDVNGTHIRADEIVEYDGVTRLEYMKDGRKKRMRLNLDHYPRAQAVNIRSHICRLEKKAQQPGEIPPMAEIETKVMITE